MKIQLGFLGLTASLAVLAFKCGSAAESTLRFLSIFHRHGNRAPLFSYPLDPYKNDSFWPNGREELLNIGKVNMLTQGEFLRQRYNGFIPAKYHSSEVLARSSYKNRTIASDQLLLAGLFPPVDDQVWKQELPWQPIPVLAIDPSVDDMFCITKPCALLTREFEKWYSSDSFKKFKDSKSALMDAFREHAGVVFGDYWPSDMITVEDNLIVQAEQGFKLPEWAKNLHPENMTLTPLDLMIAIRKDSKTVVKLISGVFINDIMSEMLKKREQKNAFTRLLNLYSGHDNTIQNMWTGMGITDEMPRPGYGALFIIELHEVKGKYRVKVLYKHSATEKNLQVLSVKGCEVDQQRNRDDMCNLDILNSVLAPVKITDFDKECFSPLGLGPAVVLPQC